MLKRLKELYDEMNTTNSANEKKEILKKYEDLKDIISLVYNPLKPFNVTSKTLKKWKQTNNKIKSYDLITLLNHLADRKITGHLALDTTKNFIEENKEYEDLIYKILDKNLEIGVSVATINKVFKKLIPEFKVQLANKFTEKDFLKYDTWFASRKMDGVRLITIVEGDNVKFFSRTGNEFFTLDVRKKEILKFVKDNDHTNFVLDGEVCIVDENGNENFTDIIKQVRKKNYTIPNPKYKVFDLLTLIEFENQKGVIPFSSRYKSLKGLFGNLKYIDVLEQIKINVREQLDDLTNIAREKNWEGLILRTDTPYEGKRTKKMLKVKDFNDAEYKVVDVIFGEIRYITEDKKEVKEEMLSAITIDHKGSIVKVGSGFSIDERKKYYKNPELIIGKTITVKYFEESKDKNGNYSLRFPVVKAIYNKERTI